MNRIASKYLFPIFFVLFQIVNSTSTFSSVSPFINQSYENIFENQDTGMEAENDIDDFVTYGFAPPGSEEDDFAGGAGQDPDNTYVDAPLGDGMFLLLWMSVLYAIYRFFFLFLRKRIFNISTEKENAMAK